jgi:hypothetical protein
VETLPEADLRLVETAVRLHSGLALPGDLDGRTRRFCELLRDADKVDIFRVVAELPFEQRAGTGAALLREAEEASGAVMDCVLRHCCVPKGIRRTRFEVRISHGCLAFGLVCPESRRMAREQGFLERLLAEYDPEGRPLWKERERAQLRILRREIEAAWREHPGD